MSTRALIIAGVGVVLAGSVHAADLPRRAAPPVFTPLPGFTWTGVYAGATVGYAFSDNLPSLTGGTNPVSQAAIAAFGLARVRTESSGIVGGGGLGLNYQFTPGIGLVVGAETDIQATDLGRRQRQTAALGPAGLTTATRQGMDWLGTFRGRVGYAFDRVLIYGTGGLAYGSLLHERSFSLGVGPGAIPLFAGRNDGVGKGVVYGGGIEYALPSDGFLGVGGSTAVTVKAEYLRYDLGGHTVGVNGVGLLAPLGTQALTRFNTEGNIFRAGVNIKFGT